MNPLSGYCYIITKYQTTYHKCYRNPWSLISPISKYYEIQLNVNNIMYPSCIATFILDHRYRGN